MCQASAVAIVSVPEAPSGGKQLQKDVKGIEEALMEEDVRSAMRIVDGKSGLAPDAKARCVLPGLFPSKPLADIPAVAPAPDPASVDSFMRQLEKRFTFSPKRRGPGPGGGRSEFWSWLPAHEKEWRPVADVCLQLALGRSWLFVRSVLCSTKRWRE